MAKPKFSIVIPAYNEEASIAKVIKEIKSVMNPLKKLYEIIVVSDGSTDKTSVFAEKEKVVVISHPYNIGYGGAIKTGVRNAKSDIIIIIDADNQHDANDITKLIKYADKYTMVVGARDKHSKIRGFGIRVLHLLANYLTGKKIPDLTSGFRSMKKEVVKEFIHLLPNGFSFSTTITLCCFKEGYPIKYVPITIRKRYGKPKLKPFRDGLKFIILLLRMATLFNPLKIFLPVSLAIFIPGFIYLIFDILSSNISDASLILCVSALIIFFFGLIADQISFLRRYRI